MPPFLVLLFIQVALAVIGELLRPKPEVENAKPAGLETFSLPTAQERAIPVVLGTHLVEGANVVWYGDYRTSPIIKKIDAGKQTISQTIGYRYYLGILFGVAHAIDALKAVRVGEKIAWSGHAIDGDVITISNENLFGGDEKEGGVAGQLAVATGQPGQVLDPYLQRVLPDCPAGVGVANLVLRGAYVGNSQYVKPWAFLVSHFPKRLGSGFAQIGDDANPADMLYEILTAPWGAGLAAGQVDKASFLSASKVLFDEQFGLSLMFDSAQPARDMLDEILRHVAGLIYAHPTTGLMTLKLARADYDVATLPTFDPASVVALEDYAAPALDETSNEIKVVYTQTSDNAQKTVISHNLANRQQQGQTISQTMTYAGVRVPELAARIAQRDLRLYSTPLSKVRFSANRRAGMLLPGDCIKFSWPDLGITGQVLRVASVEAGQSGAVSISAVDDVFALDAASFSTPAGSLWVNPVGAPANPADVRIMEMPYQLQLQTDGAVSDTKARPWIIAAAPGGGSLGFAIDAAPTGSTLGAQGYGNYATRANLEIALTRDGATLTTTGTFSAQALADIRAGKGVLLVVDDEMLTYETVTQNLDGTVALGNLHRGLLDSIPAPHLAGAAVYVVSDPASTVATFDNLASLDTKVRDMTALGTLDPAAATLRSVSFAERALRPIPPGGLTINSLPDPAAINNALSLSWRHRDRTADFQLTLQTDGDIGPEVGVTYALDIFGENGTPLRSVSLAENTYTYALADEIWDAGRAQSELRFRLKSTREGHESFQIHDRTIQTAGWGIGWGENWAGNA